MTPTRLLELAEQVTEQTRDHVLQWHPDVESETGYKALPITGRYWITPEADGRIVFRVQDKFAGTDDRRTALPGTPEWDTLHRLHAEAEASDERMSAFLRGVGPDPLRPAVAGHR